MAITQRDIALKAGVSQKTVSFYFSNQSKIAPKTCARIKKIIEESNYCINSAAQSIRTKKFYRIALVVVMQKGVNGDVFYPPHLFTYINSVAEELSLHGYALSIETFLINGVTEKLENEPKFFRTLSVDGIIGIAGTYVTKDVDEAITQMGVPVVWLNRDYVTTGDCISFDEETHGRLIGEYLVQNGYKKCAWFGPNFTAHIHVHSSAYLRYIGLKNICAQHNIELVSCLCDNRYDIFPSITKFFDEQKVQAIVNYNFDYSDAALLTLMNNRLRHPDDVELIKVASQWEYHDVLNGQYTILLLPEVELSKNGVRYILSKLNNQPDSSLLKACIGQIKYKETKEYLL